MIGDGRNVPFVVVVVRTMSGAVLQCTQAYIQNVRPATPHSEIHPSRLVVTDVHGTGHVIACCSAESAPQEFAHFQNLFVAAITAAMRGDPETLDMRDHFDAGSYSRSKYGECGCTLASKKRDEEVV